MGLSSEISQSLGWTTLGEARRRRNWASRRRYQVVWPEPGLISDVLCEPVLSWRDSAVSPSHRASQTLSRSSTTCGFAWLVRHFFRGGNVTTPGGLSPPHRALLCPGKWPCGPVTAQGHPSGVMAVPGGWCKGWRVKHVWEKTPPQAVSDGKGCGWVMGPGPWLGQGRDNRRPHLKDQHFPCLFCSQSPVLTDLPVLRWLQAGMWHWKVPGLPHCPLGIPQPLPSWSPISQEAEPGREDPVSHGGLAAMHPTLQVFT
jgi:hypothetical protein